MGYKNYQHDKPHRTVNTIPDGNRRQQKGIKTKIDRVIDVSSARSYQICNNCNHKFAYYKTVKIDNDPYDQCPKCHSKDINIHWREGIYIKHMNIPDDINEFISDYNYKDDQELHQYGTFMSTEFEGSDNQRPTPTMMSHKMSKKPKYRFMGGAIVQFVFNKPKVVNTRFGQMINWTVCLYDDPTLHSKTEFDNPMFVNLTFNPEQYIMCNKCNRYVGGKFNSYLQRRMNEKINLLKLKDIINNMSVNNTFISRDIKFKTDQCFNFLRTCWDAAKDKSIIKNRAMFIKNIDKLVKMYEPVCPNCSSNDIVSKEYSMVSNSIQKMLTEDVGLSLRNWDQFVFIIFRKIKKDTDGKSYNEYELKQIKFEQLPKDHWARVNYERKFGEIQNKVNFIAETYKKMDEESIEEKTILDKLLMGTNKKIIDIVINACESANLDNFPPETKQNIIGAFIKQAAAEYDDSYEIYIRKHIHNIPRFAELKFPEREE